ncbi:hypothetical protein [Streptomyces sp. LUP47B]|uniref:hypothetical protein n=1 Tax=Streptomyces sp. LUP47B TaxID=1890286 RepID=UPI00114CCB8E|nr:hypothetical protein [Streptomyces sp. LUP47B]
MGRPAGRPGTPAAAAGAGAAERLHGRLSSTARPLSHTTASNYAASAQFYRDSGFTHGYWLICGVCLVGAALALLVPRAKRIDEVDAGQAVA